VFSAGYGVSVLGNSLRLPSLSQPVTDDNAAIIQQYAVDAVARLTLLLPQMD